MDQDHGTLVNTKLVGKWMLVALKILHVGIDPLSYPWESGRYQTVMIDDES